MADNCPECPPEGLPAWMGTYGDMMTLLLCFFVLLFAFSTMDSQKFKTMMEAFQGSFGVLSGGKTVSPEALITNTRINNRGQRMKFIMLSKEIQKKLNDIEEMKKELEEEKKEDKTEEGKKAAEEETKFTSVKITRRGLEISLGDDALFQSGEAVLSENSKKILDSIISKIDGLDNEVVIEGHTDDVPINSQKYPSNWELSTSRATNVLKYMIQEKPELKGTISAAGYADTKPKAKNDTEDGRRKNRRVDIVILKSIDERIAEELAKEAATELGVEN